MREPHSPVTGADSALWTTPDEQASEIETSEFLKALTFLVKPVVAVEVGAYHGYSSLAIGQALSRNGRGHLHAFEADHERARRAFRRCEGLPVTVHAQRDTDAHTLDLTIGLLFIDGEIDNRAASYARWAQHVERGGLVVVHDSLKYGDVARFVERIPYPRIDLRSPRGLSIAVKTHDEWELT